MPNRTTHQVICRRTKNGLRYNIPKIINSDIGFQLMFGEIENHWNEEKAIRKNENKYETTVYSNLTHFKRVV